MENKTKPKGYWTYEKCLKAAIEQGTRNNFRIKASGATKSAIRNNWLDKIYKEMNHFLFLKVNYAYVCRV